MLNALKLLLVAWLIAAGGIIAFDISYSVGPNYQYKHAIGAHVENAYDASDFEVMYANLLLVRDGMHEQGLVPSDCGKAFAWEQTQDWCMGYQYQYLDGLIARTQVYLDRVRAGNISQFSDVYEQMINNMRSEMKRNGPVDWVAQPAWMLKHAPLYYWGSLVWTAFLLVGIISTSALIISAMRNDGYGESKSGFAKWAFEEKNEEQRRERPY